MAIGLLLILVAAVRSEGFHHPDEHFQVLEFAGAKLGLTPWSALAWEYRDQMRPWLQAALYTLGARALLAAGIDDPFTWALSFRLFSGLVAWLGLVGLALCSHRWFPEPAVRHLAIRGLVLAYFGPYLAVRTSAESLSTSCIVLALSLIILRGDTAGPLLSLVVGALLGLACGLRYATAVMVASIVAWMVLIGGLRRRLGWIALGMAAALSLGLVVDRWGYGEWTLPAWHYLAHNFGEDRAALDFGALPWYGYIVILCQGPFVPLNLVVAGAAVVAWVRQPRHILTWACAPLALVHCAIAHKELRFLFPIAMLSPLLLALGLGVTVRRPWLRALAKGLLAYDLCGLVALSLLPAQPQVAFQRFVRHRFPQGLHAFVATPVSPWVRHGLTMYFYGPLPPDLRPWPGGAALDGEGVTRLDLIVFSWDAPPPTEPYTCRPIYRSIPAWLSRRGWPRSPSARPLAWDLLRCVVASHSATLGTSRWAPSRGGG